METKEILENGTSRNVNQIGIRVFIRMKMLKVSPSNFEHKMYLEAIILNLTNF